MNDVAAPSRGRPRSMGQALVEFALVLPVFLLLLFGAIDVGRLIYMNSVISQAAREGARIAAVEAYWVGSSDPSCGTAGGPVCPSALTGATSLQADVAAGANRMVVPFGPIATANVSIACTDPSATPTGSWTGVTCPAAQRTPAKKVVSVRVQISYQAITPLISNIIGPLTLSGSATMTIN